MNFHDDGNIATWNNWNGNLAPTYQRIPEIWHVAKLYQSEIDVQNFYCHLSSYCKITHGKQIFVGTLPDQNDLMFDFTPIQSFPILSGN